MKTNGFHVNWPGKIIFGAGRLEVLGDEAKALGGRRVLLVTTMLTALLLLQAPCLAAQAEAGSDRPNIVFVLADDLGYGDLPCYGNPIARTPHLDRFATESMRFTDFYAPSAVCSPSRAGILTGRSPLRCGVITAIQEGRDMHLRSSEITIATVLKEAGYDTCHVGKWHLNGKFNSSEQPQPGDHGFSYWMATQNNALPSHENPETFVRNGQPLGKIEGFSGPLVAREAVEWLEKRPDKSKPFFLNVSLHEPHLPIGNDPANEKPYADLEPMKRKYFGSVTQMDAAFGDLMAGLDRLGLADNTIVFFTSDNGPETLPFGPENHGSTGGLRGAKRMTYEGGVRVPLLVRWPGRIAAGSVTSAPAVGMDMFPTFCALAGIALPQDRVFDGQNLLPVLTGGKLERERPIFLFSSNEPGGLPFAMRLGEWKILASRDFRRCELYRLSNDPHETVDRSTFLPQQVARLLPMLKRTVTEMQAGYPPWADRDTDWDHVNPNRQFH
jgi:arylsulfatase A